MKYIIPVIALAAVIVLGIIGFGGKRTMHNEYKQITQKEAKEMMDTQDVLILDVREQHEYDSGHIAGAVLLPVGTISAESAAAVIPAKNTVVLVYCRSGNRSKTASSRLARLGYTKIYEFGGITTWPYGTVTE